MSTSDLENSQCLSQHSQSQERQIRKIAIISDAWKPQINGVVRVLDTVATVLRAAEYDVKIIGPDLFRTIPCPSYPEIPLAIFPMRQLTRLLDTYMPDAIHIATEGPLGFAAKRWCKRNSFPFTTAYHTKFPEYVHARSGLSLNFLYERMRKFHQQATATLAPSASVFKELKARGFEHVNEWSHGVDTQKFRPRGKDYLKLARPIHLYIGRIAIEKNIAAFLELDIPGSKVVVGYGPQKESLIKKYPDTYFFTANGDQELAQYYSAADVFVFPSKTDTFGLTMLEALSCGVPVAAFPVTGPLDVLKLDHAGETAVGCLHEDLSIAIQRASSKSPTACRLYASQFTWDQVAKQFLNFLAPGPVQPTHNDMIDSDITCGS